MLTINQISNYNYNYNQIKVKNNKNIQKQPSNVVNNYNTYHPTFMGVPYGIQKTVTKATSNKLSLFIDSLVGYTSSAAPKVKANSIIESIVLPFAIRKDPKNNFTQENIRNIAENASAKNLPLLNTVLGFKNNIFSEKEVISLLNYIDKEDTSIEEFEEKVENLNNLQNTIKTQGYNKSVLSNYVDEISSSSLVDLLKSDLLLNESKYNFNTLQSSYNVIVKYFEHQLTKKKAEANDAVDVPYEAKKLMRENFTNMLLLGMIFDKSACNELFYNRGLYVGSNYVPRLKMLNNQDLELLRKVQTSAVTEKENKGGDLSVYEISLDDKISMLDLLAANREIINSGHRGLNFYDYVLPVDTHNNHGNFKINFQDLKRDLTYCVLERIGVDPNIVEKYKEEYNKAILEDPELKSSRDKVWDINYCHLLNAPENSILRKIITNETTSNFENWIFREGFVNSSTKPLGTNDLKDTDYIAELYEKGILDPKKSRFLPYMVERINKTIGLYRKNLLDVNNREHNLLLQDKSFDYIETLHTLKMLSVINEINRRDFEKNGVNFEKWLNPETEAISEKFKSRDGRREKVFTVKNWNRRPMESLFDGNYTTCCTGIDKDQGASFLSYMTNTCSTTLEVRTEKNKVVAMSRILMTKINGKLSMVVENIEVNNKIAKHYLYDDVSKYKFREMIFDYARNFAKEINKTSQEIPVYFCGRYVKVADIRKGLKEAQKETDIEILGAFENNFYVNSYGSQWDMLRIRDAGDEFFLHVGEITEKTEPPKENIVDKESDSNYNHGDSRDYK